VRSPAAWGREFITRTGLGNLFKRTAGEVAQALAITDVNFGFDADRAYDVRRAKVIADGATANAVKLQKAIDASTGVIWLPKQTGAYLLASEITLPDGLEIWCEPGTVITASALNYNLFKCLGTAKFFNATITRADAAQNTSWKAINLDGGSYAIPTDCQLIVRGCAITGFDVGVYADGGAAQKVAYAEVSQSRIIINNLGTGGSGSVRPTVNLNQCQHVSIDRNYLDASIANQAVNNIYCIGSSKVDVTANRIRYGFAVDIKSNADNAVDHVTVARNRFIAPRLAVLCLADTNPIRAVEITGNQVDTPTTDVANLGVFHFGTSVNVAGGDAIEHVTGKGNHVKNAPYSVWYADMLAGDTFGVLQLEGNYYYNTSTAVAGGSGVVNHGGAGTYRSLQAVNDRLIGNANARAYLQGALSFLAKDIVNVAESGCVLAPNAYSTGSQLGALTGCTTVPTGTLLWNIVNGQVTLYLPSISAVSNSAAATITGGVPAPATTQVCVGTTVDNGTVKLSLIQIEVDGTITLYNGLSTNFTAAGNKGVSACTVTYRIN